MILLIFLNLIILISTITRPWNVFDFQDYNLILNNSREAITLKNDINYCERAKYSCDLRNEDLYSKGNFENQCCYIKTSLDDPKSYLGCHSLFYGKYFESSLYSLALKYQSKIYYNCNGRGYKTFEPSSYIPYVDWEIAIKEKYECLYSYTEETCRASPKSFSGTTSCVWFSCPGVSKRTFCYGVKEFTDYEFNRLAGYMMEDNAFICHFFFSFFIQNITK